MKWIYKKASTILLAHYAHMLEYRAEIFLWALSNSLPIILMGVWVKASQNGNFGLSSVDFIRYFFSVFLTRQFTTIWVIWEFEREVVEGKLSFRLLQPIDPAWHHVARHLAEKMTRIPLIILFAGLFFLLYPDAAWFPTWKQLLLYIVAIALAFSLRFIIQYTFAMLAFWTERASAIQQFWFLFDTFLSGTVAPLEVFPATVRRIVEWTPFPYTMHFPAALLTGLEVNIGQSIAIILGWTILFAIANRWLWRKGLRQYSGMGA
ncbi:ABC-2 family transporter protein [Myxosarcina sp. GI1]|uniref:ABC transporter permease n=1 Tax=Myxosarcina sp. GI1 TaxID=1541065 RepID=UPI00056729B7|nr:ABC-2 family transporter protein [Myxosarcina sp. GI1]